MTEPAGVEPPWMDEVDRMLEEGGVDQFLTPANGGPAYETIQILKVDLQALFDLATGSMDFGSGFWDNEETETARRVAVLIGVDPMEGTPSNFRRSYAHAFDAGTWGSKSICKWCSRGTSEPVHREAP